jgi:hypothetical protein
MESASDGETSQGTSLRSNSRKQHKRITPGLAPITDDESEVHQNRSTPVVNVSLQATSTIQNQSSPLPRPVSIQPSQTGSARVTPAPINESGKASPAKHTIFKPTLRMKTPVERMASPSGYSDDAFHE